MSNSDIRPAPDTRPVCKFGDPACPCQDGDPCHYVATKETPAMSPPARPDTRAAIIAARQWLRDRPHGPTCATHRSSVLDCDCPMSTIEAALSASCEASGGPEAEDRCGCGHLMAAHGDGGISENIIISSGCRLCSCRATPRNRYPNTPGGRL